MDRINGKATRRGGRKSRGGCARCKSQHLKCDEARPQCGRCSRLGVDCPGYSHPLKWSTKHEFHAASPGQEIGNDTSQLPYTMSEIITSEPPAPDLLDWSTSSFPLEPIGGVIASDETSSPFAFDSSAFEAFSPNANEAPMSLSDLLPEPEFNVDERQLVPQRRTHGEDQPNNTLLRSLGARLPEPDYRMQKSLTQEPYELLSYYFKVVPRIYSLFDSERNPFRTAVSSSFSSSLAVNLAAQSMAAAFLVEVHPRFGAMGRKLREQALEAIQNESRDDFHVLLALMMCAPTGNWHQPRELGLTSYKAMQQHLDTMAASGRIDANHSFFQEAMIHWEMYLSYAADPETLRSSQGLIPAQSYSPVRYEVHPWTGVSRETSQLVGAIGRLVRSNRLRSLNQKFVTQSFVQQMATDLATARSLESQLLACQHPNASEVASTGDETTPIWHLTTLAEIHRYAGLLQLYRVFPDLLSDRLSGNGNESALVQSTGEHTPITEERRNEWLTAFAMEGLKQLEAIALESGTKDFQPFLLVVLASELACQSQSRLEAITDESQSSSETTITKKFAEVSFMRKFVLDRLHSFLRLLPPKPIRVCLDIVNETWRRMDSGHQDVYWLDVVIQNGWETILA